MSVSDRRNLTADAKIIQGDENQGILYTSYTL